MVMMRSASPSFWVRSTIPSSRYRLTMPLWRTGRAWAAKVKVSAQSYLTLGYRHPGSPPPARVRGRHPGARRRAPRVGVDAAPPQRLPADFAFHVGGSLRVAPGGQRVLRVVEHPDRGTHGTQGVTARGDGAVAGPLDLPFLPVELKLHGERVLRVHHRGRVVGQQRRRAPGQVLG